MKYKLWFADLNYVNPGKEWTILPFPLNISFIASYVHKMMPDKFEIRIFKDPSKLLHALSEENPDVVALSNYIWNKNLSLQFAKHIKETCPSCITVMGGPNYNFTELAWVESFARENQQIDFHIEGEGEVKFYNLMACCEEHNFDLEIVKKARPAGVTYLEGGIVTLVVNKSLNDPDCWSRLQDLNIDFARNRLRDLNDIPSPYLTGLLDEFLADKDYCPIIETNRGCPYSCTFCNWGAMGKSKSAMFSLERVLDELKYISEKNVSTTPYLYIGDANFGLFDRDVEIAQLLRELKDCKGFPQNIYMYFAKNSTDKVVKIAATLSDMTPISLSRQTQNKDVLENIKRSNISVDTFNSLASLAKELGIQSFVELIHGLPGESKESFYDGVRDIMRQKVDMLHIFPAMLLDGSEMSTAKSRSQYGIKGEKRLIDGCAGIYGPVKAMEFEEIITETKAMSRSDYFELRVFHFIQALFLDTKIYRDVEVLLGDFEIIDLLKDIIENYCFAPEPFKSLVDDFIRQAHNEFYREIPTNFKSEMVQQSANRLVKLNPLFISKLLYEPGVRDAFHQFLKDRILTFGMANEIEIASVLNNITASVFPFDGESDHILIMNFDAIRFSKRLPFEKVKVSDYLSDEPRSFLYTKTTTYDEYIKRYSNLPIALRVYEILMHHTRTIFSKTLTHQLTREITEAEFEESYTKTVETSDSRIIRLEGGWLY
jgi:radical SAM superfamily enzyme YgiQ (UPF0313 family)